MRGGKRPGAGAPKGNMNALKNGAYSKQFAQIGALFASDPKIREALLALAHKHNIRQHKANEVAALLFTRLFQRAEDIANGRHRPAAHPKPVEGPTKRSEPAEPAEADSSPTRLLQRAEDVAAGRLTAHPGLPPQRAVEGAQDIASGRVQPPISKLQHPARTAGDGLNLRLPVDDLDSIKTAAALAAGRQIRSAIRGNSDWNDPRGSGFRRSIHRNQKLVVHGEHHRLLWGDGTSAGTLQRFRPDILYAEDSHSVL